MKGIILAAGKGTRLYPTCQAVNKQLVPIYDKPLIYYPLATLMQAGIKEVLLISNVRDLEVFQNLLGDGSQLGINISYTVQEIQCGIADAFRLGKTFIGNDSVCLILGDNIFWNPNIEQTLEECTKLEEGAMLFGLYSDEPSTFGVVEFDEKGHVISLEEKPEHPKSNYIVPGLYFYDDKVSFITQYVHPSARGEFEITSINQLYLKEHRLKVVPLDDMIWFDAGTPDRLLEASNRIKELQQQEGRLIGCIEQIAYEKGFIDHESVVALGKKIGKSAYGQYVANIEK